MTLARILATGRGRLRARVELEGWPDVFVTHRVMEQTDGFGRPWIEGLLLEGMKIGARLDLPTGKIEAEGFRVQLVDRTRARKVIGSFRTPPSAKTYLSEYVSASATTIPVFSTEGFDSDGVVHLKTEAIRYTGKTATTFTGCTRGYWNTVAQAHFTQGTSSTVAFEADAAGVAYPEVTNRPTTIEGRRAWLYLYGDGDSPTGNGTQRWQGSCTTSPRYEGPKVSFAIDPPTSILKQEMGGDVAAPIGIRGIYYPWSAPFVIALTENTSASRNSPGVTVIVRVVGFFDDQQAFCTALTAAIAAAMAASFTGTLGTIEALVTDGGFELVYTTPATGFRFVEVNAAALGGDAGRAGLLALTSHDRPLSDWTDETGAPVHTVLASTRYAYAYSSPVPRAYWGTDTPFTRADSVGGGVFTEPTLAATYPGFRIYLAGLFALSTDTYIGTPEWLDEREDGAATTYGFYRIESFDAATHSAIVALGGTSTVGEMVFRVLGPNERFRVGRLLAAGNVGDLITNLIANSPALANAGAMPLVRAGDVELSAATVNEALSTRAVSDRVFAAFGQETSLEDVIGPELVAAGMHWTIDTTGKLTAVRARLAAATEAANHTIAPDPTKDTGPKPIGGLPTLEEAATWGFISQVRYLTGYDFIEDDHVGAEIRFNNVRASAPNRAAKVLEIAQKSMPGSRFASGGLHAEPTQVEVGVISRFWLGLLGGKYDILSIPVPFVLADVQLGETVAVTTKHVPNDEGGMGIVDKLGILIGYSFDLDALRGKLELLMHSRRIAGYAPEFLVLGQTLVSDTTYDITLDVASETDKPLSTWLRKGDRVRALEWNSTTPDDAVGEVVDLSGDVARVTFDGSSTNLLPAPASIVWTGLSSPTITTGQTDPLGGTDATLVADDSGSFESMRTAEVPYTTGTDLRCEVWVEKDVGATSFAEVRVGLDGVYPNVGVQIDPITGAAQVRGTSSDYRDVESSEAIVGWWRLRFTKPGAAGSTAAMRVWPAWGTTYPTSSAGAVGSATVYAPRIAYAQWFPGSKAWTLGLELSTSYASTHRLGAFCFVADDDGIAFSDANVPAQVLAP